MPDDGVTAEETDFAAIMARLHEELERVGDGRAERAGGDRFRPRRREAEALWAVSADRPFLYRPGPWGRLRGLALAPVKALLRKLMRWYVEPVAADQRRFNHAVLLLADALAERVAALEAGESAVRAPTDEPRQDHGRYVELFRDAAPVLQLACGRGELLGLLREAGIEARGVDSDPELVAATRARGLDVEQAGALDHLEALDDASLGGVFAGRLAEPLPAPLLVRVLEAAAVKLRPGGVLVVESKGSASPLGTYVADPAGARPLLREALERLARQTGFDTVDVRFADGPEASRLGFSLVARASHPRA